ncbi:hypothetical protein JCM3774_006610 [Rhodotorula dairenensis]
MSHKHELEVWVAALEAFDARQYDSSLARFEEIAYYSKVLFNTAIIHAIRGQHERAIADFARAITLDPFFAVAHFQLGVSAFLIGQMEEARKSFDRALSLFHDNHTIDYRQLGLDFQLYSCEVRFNRGLSLIYAGKLDIGMQDLLAAQADKQSDMHDVIDEAISDQAVGYTVFSIPVGIAFRPPAYKIENLEVRDYLGKATVIAATDAADLSTGFAGTGTASNKSVGTTAASESLRPVPSRSQTSAGRLERAEQEPVLAEMAANGGGRSLRRSRTAKPALASPSRISASPPPASTTQGATQPALPSIWRAGTDDNAAPLASRDRPPVPAASVPPSVARTRSRSNTTSSKRAGLVRSRSFTGRTRAMPPEAFFLSPAPTRPPTRPPPLDLGLLRPPGSPGHRRSASSPALLSAELVPLRAVQDAPSRFEQLQKQAARDLESSGDFAGNAYAARLDRFVGPDESVGVTEPLSFPSGPFAPPPVSTYSPSTETRANLASVLPALRSESPSLARTSGRPDNESPSSAQVGMLQPQYGHGGGVSRNRALAPAVYATQPEKASGLRAAYQHASSMATCDDPPTPMRKIRIRLRWHGEVRAMSILPDVSLDAVRQHVATKLCDTDGTIISLRDEEDWQCAVDIAREGTRGFAGTGQLEVEVVTAT